MKIKNTIKKYIAIILIFSISFVNSVKAELTREKSNKYYEKPVSYDIEDDFEGFYKNFIIELGGVRVALYDSNGSELWKFDILPKQFESKAPVYEIETDFIKTQESIFLSYVYKLDLSNFKFSDNIPRLTQYMNGDDEISYVKFNDWTDWDEVWYWASYENGKNQLALLNDLGVYESYNGNKYLNPNINEEMEFIAWFNTLNNEKKTYPSMLFEPLTFYPETTEQIYCNKLAIAFKYGMQWNSNFALTITEHIENNDNDWGIFGFLKEMLDVINAVIDFFTKVVYYNVGVLEQAEYASDSGELKWAGYRDYEVSRIQEPKVVNLTYTETTTYSCDWKTKGFWRNFEGYKMQLKLKFTDEEANKYYDRLDLKQKQIYKNTEELMIADGYEKKADGTWELDLHLWKGTGNKSCIDCNHNRNWTWVPLYEGFEIIENTEKMLGGLGILFAEPKIESNTKVYKYGAELFIANTTPVATQSQILLKFHSNLEQLGGTGEIDETYNLFGKVGSSDYTYITYTTIQGNEEE